MDEAALFPGCLGFGVSQDLISIRVSDWDQAWKLNQSYLKTLAGLARFLGREQLEIIHSTPGKPNISILASMADENVVLSCQDQYRRLIGFISEDATIYEYESVDERGITTMTSLNIEQLTDFIKQEDCDADLAQLAYAEKVFPVWIVDQISQEVLLANRVAIAANCKPPREILSKDISVLWEEEALRSLTDLVNLDKRVTDHTNIGWRWKKEEGSSVWVRVKHEFNVDYQLINFLGLPCRFEIVKNAVPV